MNKRNILIAAVATAVVLAGAVWYFLLRSDAPPPATIEGAVAAVTGETTTTVGGGETATSTTAAANTTAAPTATAGIDGAWMADDSVSFVGYRIEEELASLGAITAVGRTSDIEASLSYSGTSVTDLSVVVDMTTLQSDRSQRDGAMRTRGLETGSFPSASFVLTSPIELDVAPTPGATITATASGDLTLHGVTQPVTLDIEGSLVEGTMVVVGSIEIALVDYGIEKPTGFSVLGIADVGLLEIQLAFVRG